MREDATLASVPRSGWRGALDRFIGPGATASEKWLQFTAAILSGISLPLILLGFGLGYPRWQLAIAGLLAFDTVGGVVTNATHAAKRWYHRPDRPFRDHLAFACSHATQLLLFSWIFRARDWGFFFVFVTLLIGGFLLMWVVPEILQRPVGMLLYSGVLVLALYVFPGPAGMEWFTPVFFLKLLIGHFVVDRPLHAAHSGERQ